MRQRRPRSAPVLACIVAALGIACSGERGPLPEPSSPAPAGSPAPAPASPDSSGAHLSRLPQTFSGQLALDHVLRLAGAIGSRPTGTQKESEAADYISRQFQTYGYQVERQPFTFEMYNERRSSIEVSGGGMAPPEARALRPSRAGDVTAPVITAGIGRKEEFPPDTAGKIALVQRGTLPFSEKVANAAAAGAVAVIVYNNEAGPFNGALRDLSAVPAVGVSREDGERLMSTVRQTGAEVRVVVDAAEEVITSQNVIGSHGGECRAVIGGHYDSVDAGPGANDNASGTSVTLEAARVLKDRAAEDRICFIAFGGEELGLWGSRHYVDALSDEQKRTIAVMINIDMVGVGDRWQLSGSPSLREASLQAAGATGLGVNSFGENEGRGGGSDHASFIRAGIPAVFIHLREDPNYHTAEDKPEFIDPRNLEAAGNTALQILDRTIGAR